MSIIDTYCGRNSGWHNRTCKKSITEPVEEVRVSWFHELMAWIRKLQGSEIMVDNLNGVWYSKAL